ncbi:MAG: glycosyltransferase [Myxococcota bacterium]
MAQTPAKPDAPLIFIHGIYPRCGTNLLSRLLRLHPDCSAPRPVWEDHLLSHSAHLDRYARAVSQDWNPAWGDLREIRADLLRGLGGGIARFLAERAESPRVVTKTPRVLELARFAELFADARLLIVVRDGRAVVESGSRSFDWFRETATRGWRDGAREIRRFLEAPGSAQGRFQLVRYESLVEDRERTLRSLLDFLDLDPDVFDFEKAETLDVVGSSDLRRRREDRVHWQGVATPENFDPLERFQHWTPGQHRRFNWLARGALRDFDYLPVGVPEVFGQRAWNRLLDAGYRVVEPVRPLRRALRRWKHRPAEPSTLLLTNFVPPYLMSLYRSLAERLPGFELLLSTPMEANRPWRFETGDLTVHVQRTWTLERRWRHPQGFEEGTYFHLPVDTLPLLFSRRPTSVVSTEFGARTLQAVVYRLLRRESRLIIWALVTEITEAGRSPFRTWIRRAMLRCADAVVVSGSSGARYIESLGYPAERIWQMPPFAAVRPPRARRRAMPSATLKLLYVGQLVERKGLGPWIEALARWCRTHPERRVRFTVVGDGPERDRLAALPTPDSLEVAFVGNTEYADLGRHYDRADALVFPTLADEWGVVVNEALLHGVPVLGSRNAQAVEDLIEEGVHGWTFRPDVTPEVDAAIDRALNASPEERSRMRQGCLAQATRFDPEIVARSLLDAITGTPNEARAPTGDR